jgi:hypothetical protein
MSSVDTELHKVVLRLIDENHNITPTYNSIDLLNENCLLD